LILRVLHAVELDRLGQTFEPARAMRSKMVFRTLKELSSYVTADEDLTGLTLALEPGCDVHTVPVDVAVVRHENVSDVDSDPEPRGGDTDGFGVEAIHQREGGADRRLGARELGHDSVAQGFDDASATPHNLFPR
jgi:hypothetical protein